MALMGGVLEPFPSAVWWAACVVCQKESLCPVLLVVYATGQASGSVSVVSAELSPSFSLLLVSGLPIPSLEW